MFGKSLLREKKAEKGLLCYLNNTENEQTHKTAWLQSGYSRVRDLGEKVKYPIRENIIPHRMVQLGLGSKG